MENLDYYLKFVYEKNHEKRERFLAETSVNDRIETARTEMAASFKDNEFKATMFQMYGKEANKCWEHYFNTIQKGILCSFCLDDSATKFFDIDKAKGKSLRSNLTSLLVIISYLIA